MKTKLTLSIENSVKERAKRYAKRHQTSISQMVEDFLKAVARDTKEDWKPEEGSLVEQMLGSVPDLDKRDYKEIIAEERIKKYESRSN